MLIYCWENSFEATLLYLKNCSIFVNSLISSKTDAVIQKNHKKLFLCKISGRFLGKYLRWTPLLTISVTMGWRLNPPPTLYINVPRISTKDVPSRATWTELTHKYLKIHCNSWQTHFALGIPLIMMKQIHIFLTLLLTTSD